MKKLNPIKIKDFDGKDKELYLSVEEYSKNNQIAVLLYEKETGEYYADLSVFLEEFPYKYFMAVDVNNFPEAENVIKEYNLGTLVDYIQSGFVSYPVYDMDINELEYYDKEGIEKFRKDNNLNKSTLFDRLKGK